MDVTTKAEVNDLRSPTSFWQNILSGLCHFGENKIDTWKIKLCNCGLGGNLLWRQSASQRLNHVQPLLCYVKTQKHHLRSDAF